MIFPVTSVLAWSGQDCGRLGRPRSPASCGAIGKGLPGA